MASWWLADRLTADHHGGIALPVSQESSARGCSEQTALGFPAAVQSGALSLGLGVLRQVPWE